MTKYEPRAGESITTTAEHIVALAKQTGGRVKAIFNDVGLICGPSTTAEELIRFFSEECERRSAAYAATPEGKASARRQAKYREVAAKAQSEGILPFSIKDEAGWKKHVEVNQDPYGSCVVRYAARWANLMEAEMALGKDLRRVAENASRAADKEGITGFMYGCAVSILAKAWVHGEELRRWHNKDTQLGTEGDKANENGGVLNPAILVMGQNDKTH